ncbi:MAG: hypothetical protein QXD05_02620 [Candidatus Pacearchaeota archaeon]
MTNQQLMKRAIIAGASIALNYKEKNPTASESEIITYVTKESKRLIKEIEENK